MRATRFVESYFDAWNHRDPRAVADHLSVDGIYCDIPENVQRTHDELIVSLNDIFSDYRYRYELIGDILTSNDTIAFQYRMCPLGPTGEKVSSDSFAGAEFVRLHGNEAIAITDYYDIPGVAQPSRLVRLRSRETNGAKYAKSGLSSEQLGAYKHRLEQLMQSQQAYLRPDLTLPILAKEIDCSVNHLSQVINSGFGMSFFDYLNQNRVDYAKQLPGRQDGQRQSILSIAYAAGFNSNSSFYTAFRKSSGQTPAQYRRTQMSAPW